MRTRNSACIALAACGLVLIFGATRASGQRGDTDSEIVQLLRHLAGEVRKLRQEVIELHMETQDAKASQLEQQLLLVQAEQQHLAQQVHVHHQEILSVERQLAQPGLPPEEMQELMARRSELSVDINDRLRNQKTSLATQEAAARERLERQLQRTRTVLTRSRELQVH